MWTPKLRTFELQDKLPNLPIPSLEETCNTFIETCKPLLNEEQMQETIKLTKEFQNSDLSKKLQEQLLQYAKQQESQGKSWLEDWWFKYAYLSYKAPLPVNSNWYVAVHPHPATIDFEAGEKIDPITRSAIVLSLMLKYKEKIDKQEISIEMAGKKPLCMDQLTRIFSTTRIPDEDTDKISVHKEGKEVMVMMEDQIFVFDCFYKGRVLTEEEMQSQFSRIQKMVNSPNFEKQEAIGILTSMERSEWAKARKELISFSPTNLENLQRIEAALLTFSFDSFDVESEDKKGKNSLIGLNNRWYDKSASIITYADGNMGANGEHSPTDAPAPASVFQWVYSMENKESYYRLLKLRNLEADYLPLPTHLKWKTQPSFQTVIQRGSEQLLNLYNSTDLRTLRFNDYGSVFILGLKCPPDTWAQIAIQLTYYRLHNKLTAIYETGSTRGFKHGRTDTVRSCTERVGNFIKRFDDNSLSALQKSMLFQEAAASHRDYLIKVVRGRGIDRHLMGLRLIAGGMGVKVPLFESFGFKETSTWRLSSSNMNPSDNWFCGFGPAYEDGYGVCYCLRSSHMKFSISNFVNQHGTSSVKFREMLTKTLYDMRDMIYQSQVQTSNL